MKKEVKIAEENYLQTVCKEIEKLKETNTKKIKRNKEQVIKSKTDKTTQKSLFWQI